MSQAKVEQHKQEKLNRKKAPKKPKYKKILAYTGVTLAAVLIIGYIGYSVAVETGLYKPPVETTAFVSSVSASELESMLQSSGDSLGFYGRTWPAEDETDAKDAEDKTDGEDVTDEANETSGEDETDAADGADAKDK